VAQTHGGHIANKIVKEPRVFIQNVPSGYFGGDISKVTCMSGALIENLNFSWALSGACTYFAQDFNQAHRGGSV